MRRSPWLRGSLALVAIVLVPLVGEPAATASRDRRYFNARLGVGLEAPSGWTLSLHTGYPEILCVLVHPDGSRISLLAAPTKASDSKTLAEQSRHGLEAQHLTITRVGPGPRGGVLLEAHGATRSTELRQLYVARPAGSGKSQAVVLTLSTRAETLAVAAAAFEWAIAHLALDVPADADEEASAKASADAGAGRLPATAPTGGDRPDARVSP